MLVTAASIIANETEWLGDFAAPVAAMPRKPASNRGQHQLPTAATAHAGRQAGVDAQPAHVCTGRQHLNTIRQQCGACKQREAHGIATRAQREYPKGRMTVQQQRRGRTESRDAEQQRAHARGDAAPRRLIPVREHVGARLGLRLHRRQADRPRSGAALAVGGAAVRQQRLGNVVACHCLRCSAPRFEPESSK